MWSWLRQWTLWAICWRLPAKPPRGWLPRGTELQSEPCIWPSRLSVGAATSCGSAARPAAAREPPGPWRGATRLAEGSVRHRAECVFTPSDPHAWVAPTPSVPAGRPVERRLRGAWITRLYPSRPGFQAQALMVQPHRVVCSLLHYVYPDVSVSGAPPTTSERPSGSDATAGPFARCCGRASTTTAETFPRPPGRA